MPLLNVNQEDMKRTKMNKITIEKRTTGSSLRMALNADRIVERIIHKELLQVFNISFFLRGVISDIIKILLSHLQPLLKGIREDK